MRAATVTAVMGDGEGGGVGRVVRSEIVVSRMSEGEITLSMKSAVSTATLDVANMAVVVVSSGRYRAAVKFATRRKRRKRRKKKRKVVKRCSGRSTAWQHRRVKGKLAHGSQCCFIRFPRSQVKLIKYCRAPPSPAACCPTPSSIFVPGVGRGLALNTRIRFKCPDDNRHKPNWQHLTIASRQREIYFFSLAKLISDTCRLRRYHAGLMTGTPIVQLELCLCHAQLRLHSYASGDGMR